MSTFLSIAVTQMVAGEHYELVYSIAHQQCPWWILGIGLLPVAIGILFLAMGRRVGAFSIVGGIIWTAFAAPTAFRCHSLHQALATGRVRIAEGQVRNFHAMPRTGHDLESFEVSGVRFSYSDYIITPGFHQTASHGGPISEGRTVRIRHVGNDILTVEVLKASEH
jgi:hypothetical protein